MDAYADILDLIGVFLTIYYICVIAWVVVGIIQQLSYQAWLQPVAEFLNSIVEPYVRQFRRFVPPVNVGGAMIDLSALVAIIVLVLAQSVLASLY